MTGTSGFIGSRLLQTARAMYGDNVTAFSSHPSEGNHIVYANRTDFSLAPAELALVEDANVLIHAGAFTPKCGTEANQIKSCNSNIAFTEELLALPWRNLKKIIFLSTLDVYNNLDCPISEATLTVPTTLYGMSKLYCERMMSLHAAERGIAIQVLRIGHVYGPGEEQYVKVIPKAIERIIAGGDVELWGEGEELRSFIYISDVVTAILKAVELQEEPGVINVVGGNVISIRDLLEKLIAIGGRQTKIVQQEFSGTRRDLVFDNTKLKRYLLPEESDFTTGLKMEFRQVEG
jgi:UDP-glucose 4-epimerase|tara:strand:- start:1842 stop:2714 length:873 start_codon:yes stop_codon:yes gene_type:complete